MSKLILIRHGESEYNANNMWTGWIDAPINEKGRREAREAGEKIKNIKVEAVFVSDLIRSKQTWEEIAKVLGMENFPSTEAWEIKERSYGDLAGKNKFKIRDEYGEDQWFKWRRGWDVPIPNGETLKDVYDRSVPYFKKEIFPLLKENKNVLVCAHGNSLRALVKYLDEIPDEKVAYLEIPTGTVYVYEYDSNGQIIGKEIL